MKKEIWPKTEGMALTVMLAFALCLSAQASWYWPFGSDDDENKNQPRLSELMEKASIAIDNASDLAAEGKVEEAVAEYRKALVELDRVERENPERAATPEFATVRNKRAIINASIDSLYLSQARENARAVAVTDTTELEKRYAERMAVSKGEKEKQIDNPKLESQLGTYMEEARSHNKAVEDEATRVKTERTINKLLAKDPNSRRAKILQATEMIRVGDFAGAETKVDEVLAGNPDDASALNIKAICQVESGDPKTAAKTLAHAIKTSPSDYHAYYNMSRLIMQTTGKKASAKRYYDTGRTVGGPEDGDLEALLK